ncbi:nose resistant to fluoxetine protein 6-like [Mytilus galloprovincialis]|uniref:nose resistant to fluoxetine protein 6-like n=1 Tax=Mytilus galloprovincialis TaxID=29158 RepID=UPI003F7B7A92
MKYFGFICILLLFLNDCSAKNDTAKLSLADIVKNVALAFSKINNNNETVPFTDAITDNYDDMLNNVRSALKAVNKVENVSEFIQTNAQLNDVLSKFDVKDVLSFITNNAHVIDNSNVLKTNDASNNNSSRCLNDTQSIVPGVEKSKDWALRMIDANGKPPSGLLNFILTWEGDYEECLRITAETFKGKYCLGSFWITGVPNPVTKADGVSIKIGLCIPDTCTKEEELVMLSAVAPKLTNNRIYAYDLTCQEPGRKLDTRAIALISVCVVFVVVMSIATIFDIITRQIFKRNKTSKYTVNSSTNESQETDAIKGETYSKNADTPVVRSTREQSNKEEEKSTIEHGILGQLLLSFSVYTNGSKILSTHQSAGTLTAINGIRFISMTWIILGHTFVFGFMQGSVENIATMFPTYIKRLSFMAVMNAPVAVDTFFALSGLLLTYLTLKQMKKSKGKINWFLFYFHRFWRLTPPYMLIMGIYIAVFPYIGNGPFWPKDGFEKNYCKNTWWWNLLYINNFKPVSEECFSWTWYLANDMQFYIISPIIIVPLYFSKIAGTIVMSIFLLATSITSGIVSKHFELGVSTFGKNGGAHFDEYYQKPYCRMGPYLLGMYTGYLLYKCNCKCRINRYLNFLLWIVFSVIAVLVLYGVYGNYNDNPMSENVTALYNAVHRSAWGAAICWVIFACATGNGGFINTVLSWKMFIPFSRLTFCAYLLHPVVQFYYYGSKKKMTYWDDHQTIYEFLAHVVLSFAVAFIASLAFESPMMGLEKVIFRRERKKRAL